MLQRLEHHADLVRTLVSKDLKLRYKSTVLGYAWSVLNPLAMAMVFFFVFGRVARIESADPYILVLVTGMFPWQWFSNSVGGGTNYFLMVGPLIKKNRFPKLLVVFAGVFHDGLHYLVSIPVLLGFTMSYGVWPCVSWLWLMPLMLVLTFMMSFGLATAVGTLNVFFRDLERLVAVVLMAWFYLSPIVFESQLFIDQGVGWVVYVNPIGGLIVSWRTMFLDGTVDGLLLLTAVGWSTLALLAGLLIYRRFHWRFAELV